MSRRVFGVLCAWPRAWLLAAGKPAHSLVRCKLWMTRLLCARQVVQEVFCWSRNPTEVRHLAQRKEELYRALLGEHSPPVAPGIKLLLETLTKHQARLFPSLLSCVAGGAVAGKI